MIKNKWAMIDFKAITNYEIEIEDDGILYSAPLGESVLINELHSLEHYLYQEGETEAALFQIMEIIAKSDSDGNINYWLNRVREVVERVLR